jgi:hypothetical protein
MATLNITATHDYSGEILALVNIDQLLFLTTGFTGATFASNQFGGGAGKISNTVQIVGDANVNAVEVRLTERAFAFSAAGWQFSDWSPDDRVLLNGNDATSDVIAGSTEKNEISGFGGADTLTGGPKNDVFKYFNSSDAVAGETVDGGAGTDAIFVFSGLNMNFTGVTFTSVEQLVLTHSVGDTVITLTSNQIGAGAITSFSGNDLGAATTLIVNAVANVNLSGVTFPFWNNGVANTITINGTASGENLTGSSQNDTIGAFGGADTMRGGAGNDNLDGGAGIDTAVFSGQRSAYTITPLTSGVQLTGPDGTDTLINVEKLAFSNVTLARAATDFNGEFTSDILLQNDNGQAATWLMSGVNVAAEGLAGANPGPSWHVKDAGDFNADGKADILWQNDNGQASIWLMNGVTQFIQSAVGGNLGPTWHAIAAADFNGDGGADILWQNDNGQAAIWLMSGINVAAEGLAGNSPGPSWHVKDAEDFNGDGKTDILWQNENGAPAIWLMNGLSVLGTTGLANPGADWHVI